MAIKRRSARQIARPKKRIARPRAAPAKKSLWPISRQVHKFIRGYEALNLSGNVAYNPYQNSFTTSLAQVTNSSELTALYDQYKITYVKYLFYLEVDPSAQTASTAIWPKLYVVRDQDDSTPMTMNEARERSNLMIRVLNPNKPVVVGYKPNILNTVFYNGVTNGYTPAWNQWLDVANANVPYYGIKFNIQDFTNTNYRLRVETRVWIACKNSR